MGVHISFDVLIFIWHVIYLIWLFDKLANKQKQKICLQCVVSSEKSCLCLIVGQLSLRFAGSHPYFGTVESVLWGSKVGHQGQIQ